MLIEKTIDLEGLTISYMENNIEGDLCLCLHGNSSSKEFFSSLLLEEKQMKAIALDLPGHGKSSRIQHYAPSSFIDILRKFILKLNRSPNKIIGHSFGGHLALWLSQTFSKSEIVIISTPPFSSKKLHLNPYLPNEATSTFSLSCPETEVLKQHFPLISNDMNLLSAFINSFNRCDPLFRETLFTNIMKEGVIDEVKLIKKFNSKIKLFLGQYDQVVNKDYIQNLISKNLPLEIIEIPNEAHLFDFSKINKT